MPQLIIDIPTAAVTRINTAFAAEFNYDPASGLTQTQFTKQQIIKHIRQVVSNYEGNQAAAASRAAVQSEVEAVGIT